MHNRGGRRGFGVIDTTIAITLASLLVLAVLSFLPTAMSGQAGSDHQIQAGQWAQLELERAKGTPPNVQRDLGLKELHDRVPLRARLETFAVDRASRATRLRVTVSWDERKRQRNLTRETIWCPVAR